jgi:DNA-binding NarL/FixJ family response regulator
MGAKMVKILIVEDHRAFREMLKECLSGELSWIILEEAANGREAMEKVGSFRPDLILMDICLPEASGLELTREITANYPDTKIIIMTGYDSREYQELGTQYGAKGFFSKGEVTAKDILALVKPFQPLKGNRGGEDPRDG